MTGYIEHFNLDNWYAYLQPSEQNALQYRIPNLLTEKNTYNLGNFGNIYNTLSANINAPPGIIRNLNERTVIHILAHLLERNLDNQNLVRTDLRENFASLKYIACLSLTEFYFWNRWLLGEDEIHTYVRQVFNLYLKFVQHSNKERLLNSERLRDRYAKSFEDSFVMKARTREDDPKYYDELKKNIQRFTELSSEIKDKFIYRNDRIFWNYARFLAVRKRYDEAIDVIELAIKYKVNSQEYFDKFLAQLKKQYNFKNRDYWSF